MKTYYRVFTRNAEFFDFPALVPMMPYIVNARIDGGFTMEGVFVPYDEMRLVMKIQVNEPLNLMPAAGQA